jgi:glycosyltransferase involved in cell wall biosynthesis
MGNIAQNATGVRQDWQMSRQVEGAIKVMRIIARMNVGGPAVQVSGLLRGFDAQVFDQELVTGYCGVDEADYLEKVATDVKAVRIDGLGRSIKPRADLTALFAIVKEIRRFKPDVIHTHTAKAGVVGRVASILSGHKSVRVHTFHGHLLNGYFGAGKTKLVVLVEKFLALFTDQLLAVGAKVKDDLLAAGIGNQSKFGVMPPGLQLAEVQSRSSARKELGLNDDAIYCAFIGRITQIKRPDRFLDVVAEVKSRAIDLHFIVAGAGDLLKYCQDRAVSENLPVRFLGWREDIEVVLAAADFVLLTSDNEGTPLSLIQAGMVGIPVVATNVGSTYEVVVNGETGLLTDLSVDQLADAVVKVATDSVLRATMGSAGKGYTMGRYGVARLVKDHQDLYLKLLNRKF